MTPQDYLRRQAMNGANRGATAKIKPTTDRLRIVLPWPPTVNHSTGPTASGGRYLTAEHRTFRNEVSLRVIAAGSPAFGPDARLAVDIHLTPPDRRRFDLDNRLKGAIDALQLSGVYENDEQIDELRVVRGDVVIPGEGSAVVTISERR
ncbi:MAG: RusA family crossover junction endodeoxyribonuclease [Betaproteobacteria bacterium]|nr:RusA family crossover junction endodeoxyribonuclease [Betaproteobacteria bacterium]MBK8772819.1 RusA family crossover junction endodeoxyribonuclease [Hyphomicrobiales bacterium]